MSRRKKAVETVVSDVPAKKVTLRNLVLQLIETAGFESQDGITTEVDRVVFEQIKSAVVRVKTPKARKESKQYDTMVSDPADTLDRVMHYFTTRIGREKLGDFGETGSGSVISASVLTLGQAQGEL